jgi:hypothetical protein
MGLKLNIRADLTEEAWKILLIPPKTEKDLVFLL